MSNPENPRNGMAVFIATQMPAEYVMGVSGNVIMMRDTRGRQYIVMVEKQYGELDTGKDAPLPDIEEPIQLPVTDSAGYLQCGCHGDQREHTCGPQESDDDGDDDEQPADGESFDGGYGANSWFQHSMRKPD
jgi:hypothetical protein